MNRAGALTALLIVPGMVAGSGLCALADEWGGISQNTSYTAEASLAAFQRDFPSSDRHVNDPKIAMINRLSLDSRIAFGDDFIGSVKAYGLYSNQEGDRRGVFSEPESRQERPRNADLQEVKGRLQRDGYELSAGKILHAVGVANLFSPSNRFNNVDASNPMHPLELGLWSVDLDLDVGDDALAVSVLPLQDSPAAPPSSSRWLGPSGDASFATIDRAALGLPVNAALDIKDKYRTDGVGTYGYLLHYKASREGFDFYGVAYTGPSVYPVLKREGAATSLLNETPPAASIGGGVSATSGALGYYGEVIAQATYGGRDQSFIKYVIGISYREVDFAEILGFEEINPIVEYAGEGTFGQQTAAGYVADSRKARPGRSTPLFRIGFRESNKLSLSLGGSRNLGERDGVWAAGVEYKFTDNFRIRSDLKIFTGPPDTQYGRWDRNSHVEMTATYKF